MQTAQIMTTKRGDRVKPTTSEYPEYRITVRCNDGIVTKKSLETAASEQGLSLNNYILKVLAQQSNQTDLRSILTMEQLSSLISILTAENRDFQGFFRDVVQNYIDRY